MSTYTFFGDDNESSFSIRTSPCSSPLSSVSMENLVTMNNPRQGSPVSGSQLLACGRPLGTSHNAVIPGESSHIFGPETSTDVDDTVSRSSFQGGGANYYSHSGNSVVQRWLRAAANGSHDVTDADLNDVGSGDMGDVGPTTASDGTETISWGSFQQAGMAQITLEAGGEAAGFAEDPLGGSSQNVGRHHQAVRIGEGSVTRLSVRRNPTDETVKQDSWDNYVEVLLLLREEAEAWDDEARHRDFDVEHQHILPALSGPV